MRKLLFCGALLALAACQKASEENVAANEAVAAEPAGPVKGVDRSHAGKPAPDSTFKDPDGEDTTLAEFSGKPVLVNLWATWCAPCVKELPTIDRVAQAQDKNGGLQVVAISQDSGPHASVVAFLDSHKIEKLAAYQDEKMSLSGAMGAEVLPTTVLFDAQGREVWRYTGDLYWTGPEAAKLLAEAAAKKPG
jgi:thiol-disulfide isomerase/thioredoxin